MSACNVTTWAEVANMAVLGSAPSPVTGAEEPFGRVARLAALVLGVRSVFVTVAGGQLFPAGACRGGRAVAGQRAAGELLLGQRVVESGGRLVIEDARVDPRTAGCGLAGCGLAGCGVAGAAGVVAWAGFPVRSPDGLVVGALCVADVVPRRWSAAEVEVLETLACVASGEVALQVALARAAERAALAQTLQESLLPPRLPVIPGLQVAARYVAGGTGAEVLGDFYDVFPSVRGSWGMVVGDVCGKGVPAAKSTALARYTLRAEAHRETRPRLILAALNQALLEWLTDDPRFLTAIYATVRPTRAGASVQISSGGHPLGLVHRADGRVQALGQPGTLLGILPDPGLHDSRGLLRAGDSLVLFTDGITEARGPAGHGIYGEDRLRDVLAGLGDLPAARIADAIQQAALDYSGGASSDDTVTLVLKVPHPQTPGQPGSRQELGNHWQLRCSHVASVRSQQDNSLLTFHSYQLRFTSLSTGKVMTIRDIPSHQA
jgi:sigma-B regulation protein RsbU (phosphoserine phosphatase)